MKSLKKVLMLVGLSILAMPLNVFAEDKNYRNYDIGYGFYNKKNITFKNKSFYENLANLAVYYIFKNTPKISKESKNNIIFSRNNLNSNEILTLENFLISDEDEKNWKDLKKIKEKIDTKVKRDNEEDIVKYFKKLIKNKKIDEKIKDSGETNILKEIESKNDEAILKEGKQSVKKDIKYKKLFIKKLKNDIKEIKKVEKKHLENFLVNLLTTYIKNDKFLRNYLMPGMRHSLRFNFKNTHKVSKHVRYITLKFFDEILYEEMMNLKNNKHIKNYFKEKEKDIKSTVKDYKKIIILVNLKQKVFINI